MAVNNENDEEDEYNNIDSYKDLIIDICKAIESIRNIRFSIKSENNERISNMDDFFKHELVSFRITAD